MEKIKRIKKRAHPERKKKNEIENEMEKKRRNIYFLYFVRMKNREQCIRKYTYQLKNVCP